MRQIEALRWWTLPTGETIGAVARVERRYGYWKAYIGLGTGDDAKTDARLIAAQGTHLGEEVAFALAGDRYADLKFQAT